MKTLKYMVMLVAVLLTACTKQLNIEPTNAISSDIAITDKSGVEKAITGAYDAFQLAGLYGRNRIILGDLAADNLIWSGTSLDYAQLDYHNVTIDNGIIDGMWTGAYDGINRVNNILIALPGISGLTEDLMNTYKGEALFMRALFHFELLCYFGGVPIKTYPTLDVGDVNQTRNTVDEVYDQVIEDLNTAESLLPGPGSMSSGSTNKYAATAILARVYLTRFHKDNNTEFANLAVSKAQEVIQSGAFSLVTPYNALYAGGDNSERIFHIVFSAQDKNRLAEYFTPTVMAGRYEVAPSDSLINSWNPADSVRFDASITYDTLGEPYGIKYHELVEGSDPVYVVRLAEMYLIIAEALAYTDGDIATIQQNIDFIRARAGLEPTTANTYPELKLAVERECRFEFAFEGHRWFDLVRTKRAIVVLGIPEYQTLFPIPLSEMTTNPAMEQNPGY
jgi:starch-binding outer membrane protein, SusD/RagB family